MATWAVLGKEAVAKTFASHADFQALLTLRDRLAHSAGEGCPLLAFPFISVAQDAWGEDHTLPRTLYVGQAPGHCGLHQLRTMDQTVERLAEDLTRLINNRSNSPFWQFLQLLVECIADRHKQPKPKIGAQFAWSNILRLNYQFNDQGSAPAPDRQLAKCQLDLCVEVLRSEIATAKPSHLILAVGGQGTRMTPYDEAVAILFGDDWSGTNDVALKTFGDMKVFWTETPRAMKQKGVWQSNLEFVCNHM